MLATLAGYERELIIERITAGIAAAQKSGTRFGRLMFDPSVIAEKLAIAKRRPREGHTAKDAARLVGWNRTTLPPSASPHCR